VRNHEPLHDHLTLGTVLKTEWPRLSTEASSGRVPPGVIAIVASCKCWGSMMFIYSIQVPESIFTIFDVRTWVPTKYGRYFLTFKATSNKVQLFENDGPPTYRSSISPSYSLRVVMIPSRFLEWGHCKLRGSKLCNRPGLWMQVSPYLWAARLTIATKLDPDRACQGGIKHDASPECPMKSHQDKQ